MSKSTPLLPSEPCINIAFRIPEIFSCVLEYLYKGDYYPRLLHNKRCNSWELEDAKDPYKYGGRGSVESTIYDHGMGGELVRIETCLYTFMEPHWSKQPPLGRPALPIIR